MRFAVVAILLSSLLLLSTEAVWPHQVEAVFSTLDPNYQQSDFLTGFPHAGCVLSVSTTAVVPHGSFDVTVNNGQPGIEYKISYDTAVFATVFTMPASGSKSFTVNIDQIFGSNSPQASSGSFLVTAGTTLPLGFPGAEICSPFAGITITVTDSAGTSFSPSSGVGPSGIAFSPAGDILVANAFDNGLYRFPSSGGAAGSPLAYLSGSPRGLAFAADGKLYAARFTSGDVVQVDPQSGSIVRTVATGLGLVTGVAVDPLSGDLFVSEQGQSSVAPAAGVVRINPASGIATPFATGSPFTGPDGVVFGADGTLYVADSYNGNVVRLDRTGSPTVMAVLYGWGPDGVAIRPGCRLSVSPTTVPPHGTFTVTVRNALPGAEYTIKFVENNILYHSEIFTMGDAASQSYSESLDSIFGASNPLASSGSFMVDSGTTVGVHGETCTPDPVIATVGGSTPLPLPPWASLGPGPGSLFVNTNAGSIFAIDISISCTCSYQDVWQLATGGSRGDLMAVSPDGYLFADQADRVVRIGPPVFEPALSAQASTPQWRLPWVVGGPQDNWIIGPAGLHPPCPVGCSPTDAALDFIPGPDNGQGCSTPVDPNFDVHPVAAGVVLSVGTPYVEIQHSNGLISRYYHLANIPPGIVPSATVTLDTVLGNPSCLFGTGGAATVRHVHLDFERPQGTWLSMPGLVDFCGWNVLPLNDPTGGTLVRDGTPVPAGNSISCLNRSGSPVYQQSMSLAQGQLLTTSIAIPSGQSTAGFYVGWTGSTVNSWLVAPDGTVVGPASTGQGMFHSKGDAFEYYELATPLPGSWTLYLYGANLASGSESVSVLASSAAPTAPASVGGIAELPQLPRAAITAKNTPRGREATTGVLSGLALGLLAAFWSWRILRRGLLH